jgi:hypothetical protein
MVKATNGDSDWRREWEDEQRLTRVEIEEEKRLELEALEMERELLMDLAREREDEFKEDLRLLGMLNEDDRVDDFDDDDIPW